MTVLMVGSSHVRRFEQFVCQQGVRDFNIDQCPPVHFLGISGGRVDQQQHLFRFWHEVQTLRPRHLIVHIGGNDLDSTTAVEETILKLLTFLTMCRNTFNIAHITVLQLLPRDNTRTIPVPEYVTKVRCANIFLKDQSKSMDVIDYWNLRGMKEGLDTLCADGVHFSENGQWKYLKNIRAAILKHK